MRKSRLTVPIPCIDQIRARYAQGGTSYEQIALGYGISPSTVRRIIRGVAGYQELVLPLDLIGKPPTEAELAASQERLRLLLQESPVTVESTLISPEQRARAEQYGVVLPTKEK